jgi:UDP:flavonoid glycosyltransferase YjiC (YdhE family)
MRVLFSSTAGHGHVLPLLPLARAFLAAGHEVALATGASWEARARSEGLELLPAGVEAEVAEALNESLRQTLAVLPIAERRPRAFTNRFARVEAPRRIDDVRRVVREWRPDLLVHESGDLVAPLVAAETGVRVVHHSFGRMVPLACFDAAARETEPLWREAGLEPGPYGGVFGGGVFGGGYVDLWPPSLDSERPPDGVVTHPLRPASVVPPADEPPAWLAQLEEPIVYVTLGTIHNPLERFRVLLDALAPLPCRVVATIGDRNDPAALAPLPANARAERFVPQAHVLPRCAAVVSHAGSGSVLGSLAHGLPMLLLPVAADQFDNAASCAAVGAALTLLPDEATGDAVREGVRRILEEPSFAAAARTVAADIAAMPSADEVVARLEQ